MNHIHLYTDGACSGNPGKGGYGLLLVAVGTGHKKSASKGYRYTTNNRMELLAVIAGLEMLTQMPSTVTVFSDSSYVVDAVAKGWLFGWEKKGFSGKKNPDLWQRFLRIYRKHKVTFQWVRGHNDHPENEFCDKLAVNAYKTGELMVDEGFERERGGVGK